jgi:hypothetical protein
VTHDIRFLPIQGVNLMQGDVLPKVLDYIVKSDFGRQREVPQILFIVEVPSIAIILSFRLVVQGLDDLGPSQVANQDLATG